MKITLLEPLGIPAEVLAQYQAKLEAMGHTFVSYDTKTADPAELTARTGDSDIAIIANTPYPASVVEALRCSADFFFLGWGWGFLSPLALASWLL